MKAEKTAKKTNSSQPGTMNINVNVHVTVTVGTVEVVPPAGGHAPARDKTRGSFEKPPLDPVKLLIKPSLSLKSTKLSVTVGRKQKTKTISDSLRYCDNLLIPERVGLISQVFGDEPVQPGADDTAISSNIMEI